MDSRYAGLATLELQAHLRQRQRALEAAARDLVQASRRLGATSLGSRSVRLSDGLERLGRHTERLLQILGEDPKSGN
jgi:hypothetical protein